MFAFAWPIHTIYNNTRKNKGIKLSNLDFIILLNHSIELINYLLRYMKL